MFPHACSFFKSLSEFSLIENVQNVIRAKFHGRKTHTSYK